MIEGQLGVAERLTLTYQGQRHITEAVQLADALDGDSRGRLASFLQNSEVDLPPKLRFAQPSPGFWLETLWDRAMPGNSISDSESDTDVIPTVAGVSSVIEEADRVIAESSQQIPGSLEYETSIAMVSAEIGLTRAVGTAVDIGEFGLAQSAIDRIRVIAQKSGETDSLSEPLAYLGVAMLKKGLSIAEIEQLPPEVIRDIYLGENAAAKQAMDHFGLDKR